MEIVIDGYAFMVPDSLKQVLNAKKTSFRIILRNGVDIVTISSYDGYIDDFDGIVSMPQPLVTTLRALGFIVPESCVR